MESPINQTRRRYSGPESSEKNGGLQKTSSFNGEKRRPGSWLERLFSREDGEGYDSNGNDQATAVAAAAYVITSLSEEPSIPIPKKMRERPPEPSITLPNAQKEGKKTVTIMEPGEGSIRRPESHVATSEPEIVPVDDDAPMKTIRSPSPESTSSSRLENPPDDALGVAPRDVTAPVKGSVASVPSMKKAPTFPEEPALPMRRIPTFPEEPALPMNRIPSFAEKQLNAAEEKEPEWVIPPKIDSRTTKPKVEEPKLGLPTPVKPASELELPKLGPSPAPTIEKQSPTITPGRAETKVDAWQRAELDKIKKKYEELNARINKWEHDKKKKARRQLDKTEGELERMRLKSSKKYRQQMEDADQIAEGARRKAAVGKRNEELKLKEKANKLSRTGKVPRTCFCF